jgi:hypothetical protein
MWPMVMDTASLFERALEVSVGMSKKVFGSNG